MSFIIDKIDGICFFKSFTHLKIAGKEIKRELRASIRWNAHFARDALEVCASQQLAFFAAISALKLPKTEIKVSQL